MGVKTRRPYMLTDADFDTFCYVDMKYFLANPNSLPNRPDHLVAQQATLADAFHAKIDEYRNACGIRDNATSAFGEAAKAIREKLRWMQMALPGLTPGSDEILVPFGLDHDVPDDNDEMKNYADAIYAYWLTVRLQPLYAPFKANIDALAALFTAYETSQVNQVAAQQPAALLQNEKEDLRKQNEDVLDALFKWYRIYYISPQDEYWTQTPWGKSSGGVEEPEEPEEPDSWEDAVTGFKVSESPFGLAYIQGVLHPDADGVAIYMAEGPLGVDSQPVMPPEPHEVEVPSLPYSMDVPKNVRVWIWICHVKDGVHGAIAGALWVEIME